ncbi:MAG: hypothetical protein MZW92_14170 [Comamonadaceae bacterium]|nr:hypothetical protein [Comamonadaceae bacterium]
MRRPRQDLEGRAGRDAGPGPALDVETVIAPVEAPRRRWTRPGPGQRRAASRGYEMHMGRTAGDGPGAALAAAWLDGAGGAAPEGAVSADGRVMGSYVHGLFGADGFPRATGWRRIGAGRGVGAGPRGAGRGGAGRAGRPTSSARLDLDALLALALMTDALPFDPAPAVLRRARRLMAPGHRLRTWARALLVAGLGRAYAAAGGWWSQPFKAQNMSEQRRRGRRGRRRRAVARSAGRRRCRRARRGVAPVGGP